MSACATRVPLRLSQQAIWLKKTGQIIRRGPEVWMVCIYVGRDPEAGKRQDIGKSIHLGTPIESCVFGTDRAHLSGPAWCELQKRKLSNYPLEPSQYVRLPP